jgi:hypothetical protein
MWRKMQRKLERIRDTSLWEFHHTDVREVWEFCTCVCTWAVLAILPTTLLEGVPGLLVFIKSQYTSVFIDK